MKTLCSLALTVLLWIPVQSARAGFDDIGFSCVAKKLDENVLSSGKESHKNNAGQDIGGISSKTEHWGYAVSLENKTFQPLTDLDVKYVIFYKQEQLGVKGPPREQRMNGNTPVKAINSHGKLTFETNPVELKKTRMLGPAGSYTYFENGASSKAEDSLSGVWIRIYKGDQMLAEFVKPPNLASKEKWEE